MRFSTGWIKLWRIDDGHWLWKDPHAMNLWIRLLMMATYKTTNIRHGKGFKEIPPGTVITSRSELAATLGTSDKPIRERLKLFENDTMVAIEKSSRGTIITICNWDKYQQTDDEESPAEVQRRQLKSPAEVQPRSSDGPLSEERKKERKKEEINPPLPPAGDHDADQVSQNRKPKKKRGSSTDLSVLAKIWNENTNGLPKVAGMTDKRRASENSRLKEFPEIADWVACAEALSNWDFGRGNNARGWKATFDYFVQPATMLKFKEGTFRSKQQEADERVDSLFDQIFNKNGEMQ